MTSGARRHAAIIGALWLVLTLLVAALVITLPILPAPASEEGRVSDEAFIVLLLVSIPVFVLVEVVVVYSALRFRRREKEAAGPGGGPVPPSSTESHLIARLVA